MWQRFTEKARQVVFRAQEEAGQLEDNFVSSEHLLLGVIHDTDNVACRILNRMGVALEPIRLEVMRLATRGDGRSKQDMQLTPDGKRVIDLAYDEARQLSNNYIGTEHLLLGFIRNEEGLAGRVLATMGVELERTRREIMALQDNDSGMPQVPPVPEPVKVDAREFGEQFATEFEKLDSWVQGELTTDGVRLSELPASIKYKTRELSALADRGIVFLLGNIGRSRWLSNQKPLVLLLFVISPTKF